MNDYEEFIEALKKEFSNSKSVMDPDWNQQTSWVGYVPKEVRRIWKDLPYESQLLIYYVGGHAYRNGH